MTKESKKIIGARLKQTMSDKKIKAKQLAAKASFANNSETIYDETKIYNICSGKICLSQKDAKAFAKVLKVTPDYLLCRTDIKEWSFDEKVLTKESDILFLDWYSSLHDIIIRLSYIGEGYDFEDYEDYNYNDIKLYDRLDEEGEWWYCVAEIDGRYKECKYDIMKIDDVFEYDPNEPLHFTDINGRIMDVCDAVDGIIKKGYYQYMKGAVNDLLNELIEDD